MRPDYELRLSFRPWPPATRLSWGTGKDEQAAMLSGTDLDVRVIRAYGELLLELADRVEVAADADAAYEREHDRVMRGRRLHA